MAVRLLSYNIRYADLDQGQNAWQHRRHGVTSVIRFHDPDIVCLQEVWQDQLSDIRKRCPAFEWVAHRAANGEHTPIGYRPDRFTVKEHSAFSLSETPDDLTAYDWGATIPRVTTTTVFTDSITGEQISLVNTHFAHASQTARERSAEVLINQLATLPRPLLAAGDFNCSPTTVPYDTLQQAGFRDVRTVVDAPHGPETTFHDFDMSHAGQRIDHIFVDGCLDIAKFGVLTDMDSRARYPSDHFPLYGVFEFP